MSCHKRSRCALIVLGGRGASFCAGADLDWTRQQANAPFEDNLGDARRLAYALRTLALCGKPTLARVHGAALGGALGLIAACDLAIASRTAMYSAPPRRVWGSPPRRSHRMWSRPSASALRAAAF